MKRLSAQGIAALRELEGVRTRVYYDEAGLPTIGVGHLLRPADVGLGGKHGVFPGEIFAAAAARWPRGMTPEEVDGLLAADLVPFEAAVSSSVRVPLAQHQVDALIIFAFNVGVGAFSRSTLLRALNIGDYDAVPDQLARWNKVRDPKTKEMRESPGLTKRRAREIEIWHGRYAAPATGAGSPRNG